MTEVSREESAGHESVRLPKLLLLDSWTPGVSQFCFPSVRGPSSEHHSGRSPKAEWIPTGKLDEVAVIVSCWTC